MGRGARIFNIPGHSRRVQAFVSPRKRGQELAKGAGTGVVHGVIGENSQVLTEVMTKKPERGFNDTGSHSTS